MSIDAMNAVWRYSKATNRARLTLMAIADHHGDLGAWPSIDALAKKVNTSARSIQRDIQELVELGELVVELHKGTGVNQYKTNRYWITLPTVQSGVTDSTAGVTDSVSGVTDLANRGDKGGAQNLIEPLKETLTIVQNDFEQFWEIYPRKQGKADAFKAFKTVTVDTATIIAGATRYRDDPNRVQAFTKMAGTWLRAGCWDDEPLPERVLSREEKLEQMAKQNERIKSQDIESTQQLFAQFAEAEARAKADPPRKCEHNRIAVICETCKRIG